MDTLEDIFLPQEILAMQRLLKFDKIFLARLKKHSG